MALDDDWEAADHAFEGLENHPKLRPTLVAMRTLVALLRRDAAFEGLKSTVSMASLVLARGQAVRRVCISWDEEFERYKVQFIDPPLEFSELTTIGERGVLQVIREYLARVEALPSDHSDA